MDCFRITCIYISTLIYNLQWLPISPRIKLQTLQQYSVVYGSYVLSSINLFTLICCQTRSPCHALSFSRPGHILMTLSLGVPVTTVAFILSPTWKIRSHPLKLRSNITFSVKALWAAHGGFNHFLPDACMAVHVRC